MPRRRAGMADARLSEVDRLSCFQYIDYRYTVGDNRYKHMYHIIYTLLRKNSSCRLRVRSMAALSKGCLYDDDGTDGGRWEFFGCSLDL